LKQALAALALVLMTASAASAAPGQLCGTRGAKNCAAGEFCDFPLKHNCGYTDAGGYCRRIPKVCTREYRPVCGCDRKTYANACMANASRVSVLHAGRCKG
jgi:hypothetical protein